jgi:plastocyanin
VTPTSVDRTATPPGEIDIVDFEFSPRELTVARGDTVTWRNLDPYDHWVVSTQPDVLDSGELSQAQTYSKTFSQTGTFTYYCNIHNYMKATVTVQ